jgi:dienelactone hydrolase
MMGGAEPARCPLDPKVVRRVEMPEGYVLEEITLQTLPDRRAHVWVGRPSKPSGKVGAVLALNGHGGTGDEVVRGRGLYWYGRAFLEMGYVVIAPDVGSHELQHPGWSLMGERTWDALRCLDHVVTLPEVDPERLAVAGLSLGGETTMYVAALDTRVKAACCSGWLTTVANMKNGHCPCFNFPGLEETFDFSDIDACIAPRPLVCELGQLERAPGGFPVSIGRQALEEVETAYAVFDARSNVTLTVHTAGHVFNGRDVLPLFRKVLGPARSLVPDDAAAVAWSRFTDGPESLDGTPYHWLGRLGMRLTFDVPARPGQALELGWGGKSDQRDASVRVNGKTLRVQGGGHWGFRWLRVALPEGLAGDRIEVELNRGAGLPAFLSEVRLTTPGGDPARPDLAQGAFKARLTLLPGSIAVPAVEAFPAMRPAWDRVTAAPSLDARRAAIFRQAEKHARLANEALFRCRRYVDGWLAHADPATGLIPRNFGESRDYWNGRDSAADNYPFMVLTAAVTDPPLMRGRLLDMLRTETRLTSRVDRLPDDYSFSKKGWRREKLDLDAIIFDGAEYVKDGLVPLTEWLGPSPWSERMLGITDDIWKNAPIDSPHGKLPTRNFEVCGDLLQACSRLYWFTGDRKYLDWAIRLGDLYLLGHEHPTRDLTELRLVDHGCEVVNGLTELYVAVAHTLPAKKAAYQAPMHAMFDTILEKGRNPDGLLYSGFNPQTGAHSADLCDTWGYDYDGVYTMWLVDGTVAYRDAVRKVLGNLKCKYVGACWGDKSADGFADSIEGALNLLNREPVDSAADWVDSQTALMWAMQKPDGVIESWHGDGNFARTSLMYALWKTQGATIQPWRADVRFGAVREGDSVWLALVADRPWQGRLVFDRPRHRLFMHLPLDYTRINQFPEWFTVDADTRYEVTSGPDASAEKTGAELAGGIDVTLRPGEPRLVQVRKK